MNERTALLISKASDPKTGWLDRQKLVELIVRECAGVAHGSDQPSRDIKEYFGVEL